MRSLSACLLGLLVVAALLAANVNGYRCVRVCVCVYCVLTSQAMGRRADPNHHPSLRHQNNNLLPKQWHGVLTPTTTHPSPTQTHRLPLLSRRRRRNAPVVSLPRIDQAFQLKPQQRAVQAKGWRESLVQIGRKLMTSDADPPPRAQKETIRSVAESLETVNPTPKPALSPMSDGQWKCLYTDAPGPSGGKLGPFVGRVYQDVDMAAKKYVNILECGKKGAEQPWLAARLVATWDVVDDATWEVKFEHVEVTAWGRRVVHREFKNVSRIWKITYLDPELRVVRARRPEKREDQAFLFVLQRDGGVGR